MTIKNKSYLFCICVLLLTLLFYRAYFYKSTFTETASGSGVLLEKYFDNNNEDDDIELKGFLPVKKEITKDSKDDDNNKNKIDLETLSQNRYLARKFIRAQAKNKINKDRDALIRERKVLDQTFERLRNEFLTQKITQKEFKVRAADAIDAAIIKANFLSEDEVAVARTEAEKRYSEILSFK